MDNEGPSDITVANLYAFLAPITVPQRQARFTNWGRTFTCRPNAIFEPQNEEQCKLVLQLARRERRRLRVAGVGHSPSDLACTDEFMLRTTRLNKVLEVNEEKRYVVAQGGITLNALHAVLAQHGLAMSNLGSISEQTLAGVVSTMTHGSGAGFQVLSSYVMALTLLLADGSRVMCSPEERTELFMASICGLGTTGLILSVQLAVEPAFRLKEVRTPLKFDTMVKDLDILARSAEHVRMWWFPVTDIVIYNQANRTDEPKQASGSWFWDTFCGYHVVQILLYASRFIPSLTVPVGKFAAWLANAQSVAVDDSYKIFNVNCRYPQYTTEWAVPLSEAAACLRALRTYISSELANPQGERPHFPIEVRFSAADDLWLSPSSGQETCWIGIVQYKPFSAPVRYRALFRAFEDIVEAHAGRPHWAKAHRMGPADLRRLYPRFDDFVRVMRAADPHGVWQNPYTRRHLLGSEGEEVGPRVFKARRD